jgi:hypothetical protein
MYSASVEGQIQQTHVKVKKEKNTFITTVIMLFMTFSILNIVLILNFISILNKMPI